MRRILIVADSMAMPRNGVVYEDTWVYKMKKYYPNIDFIDRARRGTTSNRLIQEGGGYKDVKNGADLLEYYMPEVVIIQLGIVDCSPRLVSNNALSTKIINHSPRFIKNNFYAYKKKRSIRQPKHAYITTSQFSNNYEIFINRAKAINTKVMAIAIAPVDDSFVEKSPHIFESISKYNQLLLDLEKKYDNFKVLDPFGQSLSPDLMVDEMHFNGLGHDLIFSSLKIELCQS